MRRSPKNTQQAHAINVRIVMLDGLVVGNGYCMLANDFGKYKK